MLGCPESICLRDLHYVHGCGGQGAVTPLLAALGRLGPALCNSILCQTAFKSLGKAQKQWSARVAC